MRISSSKTVSEKATKEALESALKSVEGVRMTRHDDPKLKALKDGLRGALRKIQKRVMEKMPIREVVPDEPF